MKNLILLFISLFIYSCNKNIFEEISERHPDGSKKTYIKILNKGKKNELTLNKIIYNKNGEIIYSDTRNTSGIKDGVQIDSIFQVVMGEKKYNYRKRIYSNGERIKEIYWFNPKFEDSVFVEFKDGKIWGGLYKQVVNGEVIKQTTYENGKKHGLEFYYGVYNGRETTFWIEGTQVPEFLYYRLKNKTVE